MGQKLRILIIAEAANPEWVSVPLIGWSLARALGEVADVHIATHVRNREAFLRAGLIEGEDFTAIDNEAIARPLWALGNKLRMGEGKGWTMMQAVNALSYPLFERLIWKRFGADIKRGKYDVVHRITPLSPTITSPIAKKVMRAGVPFVLGPLNGGVPWPQGFDGERRREKEWLSYVRGAYKLLPGRRAMLRAASAIITGSRHTQSELPEWAQEKCIYIPENAIDPARFSRRAAKPAAPLAASFVGRMVPYKGPDMLLEAALPLLKSGAMRLEMIGDGPMLPSLKEFAAEHGITDAVTFHGWLEHSEVQDVMARTSLLAFPSIREFGGGVVLEAMALGLVPLVVDYAGPGELVDESIGFMAPIGSRAEIIASFGAKLAEIADNPTILAPMSKAARTRVAERFTWAQKAAQIMDVYDWVLGARPEPPNSFEET